MKSQPSSNRAAHKNLFLPPTDLIQHRYRISEPIIHHDFTRQPNCTFPAFYCRRSASSVLWRNVCVCDDHLARDCNHHSIFQIFMPWVLPAWEGDASIGQTLPLKVKTEAAAAVSHLWFELHTRALHAEIYRTCFWCKSCQISSGHEQRWSKMWKDLGFTMGMSLCNFSSFMRKACQAYTATLGSADSNLLKRHHLLLWRWCFDNLLCELITCPCRLCTLKCKGGSRASYEGFPYVADTCVPLISCPAG